ncbi:response regulator [Hungatella sp.]|uniref:response regulator n=1 Tax=Hungatella sp. TaxID=2613924 RepID=UPI0039915BFA
MYRILVVDDEPAAIKHICNIIAIKCPQFEVTATAEHGQEALKRLEEETPDILITDVKMPVMDGIALAERVKERYPEVLSLVVSGYQEFEYAKAAIRSGVYDYLLKPIKPSALQNALNSMEEVLAERYARKRNFLMKSLCEKNSVDRKLLERYFPAGKYYAALVRRNGLPRRYSGNSGFEIFSGRDEKIYLYGRDEMEAMYLFGRYSVLQELLSDHLRDNPAGARQLQLCDRYYPGNAVFHRTCGRRLFRAVPASRQQYRDRRKPDPDCRGAERG